MGDSTLLTFPPQLAREAVEALRTLQAKANALWQQFDERCQVQVKVGIGSVVFGMLGPPGEQRLDIVASAIEFPFQGTLG